MPLSVAQPTLDANWRSVVLFGRNVASYKFAVPSISAEMQPPLSTTIIQIHEREDLILFAVYNFVQHLSCILYRCISLLFPLDVP